MEREREGEKERQREIFCHGCQYLCHSISPSLVLSAASHSRTGQQKPRIPRAMSAIILDGKALAAKIEAELTEQVADFIENNAHEPTLAAVHVGDDPASGIYIKN